MSQEIKNLDALINEISFEIVNKKIIDENQINKMLGVLVNDGVYAWWVYTKKELDWKFIEEVDKFKEYNLIRLLLILEKISFLFEINIINDKINDICEKQKKIKELDNEIKELKQQIKNKEEKKNKENEIDEKFKMKEQINLEQNNNFNSFFHYLSKDLPSLLFFREILEKILIYARYHAKAMGD